MTVIRDSQSSATISLLSDAKARVAQSSATFAITPIPAIRCSQSSITISIGPGKPIMGYPIDIRNRGPFNLFTDMPVSGVK